VSWSYDGTASVWDVTRARSLGQMQGHSDRVTAGAVSPDGSWLATGSRDGQLKLWNLQSGQEAGTLPLQRGEIRACLFLRDAASLVAVDATGGLTLHAVPDLSVCAELEADAAVQCAALSPSGATIALGASDGRVGFVRVEGFDQTPLAITATQTMRRSSGVLSRLLGGGKPRPVYQCNCPACGLAFELPGTGAGQPAACPGCQRQVRVCVVTQGAEAVANT
jgi:hypothetical protein